MGNLYNEILNYISSGRLVIDKSTYLTIIIGQITIFGVLLAFYQFVASYNGVGEEAISKYLGINLPEYYIKKIFIYSKIISKDYFMILVVVEILYKPWLDIFSKDIPINIVGWMNFIWYAFSISYFILFIVLFSRCTKSILSMKQITDINRNETIKRRINEDFLKKTFIDKYTKKSIDLLVRDMHYLKEAIKKDNNEKLSEDYFKLLKLIFSNYIKNKKKEINLIEDKNIIVKNQEGFIHTMEREFSVLEQILNNQFVKFDSEMEKYIVKLYLLLLESNLKRESLANYDDVKITFEFQSPDRNVLNCRKWYELSLEMFSQIDELGRKKFIEALYEGDIYGESLYKVYCEKLLLNMMHKYIWHIFEEKESQEQFLNLFQIVLGQDKYNRNLANLLVDNIISNNRFDCVDLTKPLNSSNRLYVFSYLVIFYSVYRFRGGDWKYINIDILKNLINGRNETENVELYITELLKKSNIAHRVTEEMVVNLKKALREKLTGEYLDKMREQEKIDFFYTTIIKLCVYGQRYNSYYDEGTLDSKIYFVNELAKHDELMKYDNIKEMVSIMQYKYFRKLSNIPKNFQISHKSLILLDLTLTDYMIDERICYFNGNCIGKYLLAKSENLNEISDLQKAIIRKAYIMNNMSVTEYVDEIDETWLLYGKGLNFVQKEKMKSFLLEII